MLMQNPRLRGFTLVELLFTVVIGMILLAVGVPSFTNLIKRNRITADVNEVITAFQLTRSEAAKRGVPVTLCPTDSIAGEPVCNGSAGWHQGYIAFVDLNGDGARAGAGEDLLLAQGPMEANIFVNASPVLAAGLTYGGDGFPVGLVNAASALVFCDEPDDERRMRIVNVSTTGRPVAATNITVAADLRC